MPELPEVETIIQRLKKGMQDVPPLPGHTIQSVQVYWDKTIAEPDPETFKHQLAGKTIIDASRRAKYLHFPLNKGHLIAHLRMSGDIRMEKRFSSSGEPLPIQEHDRVVINFEDEWRLAFNNIRKFGRMWYVDDPQTVFGDLGPEPLEVSFTKKLLYERLQHHNRQVKPLLLDQHFIAGMGNLYTDEALFRAKIHPLRISNSLSKSEADALHDAIRTTLLDGIQHFGSSIDWIYRGGNFQNYFNVYGREGEPCPRCGTIIEKTVVGQRGTHTCPNCQPKPKKHRE